MTKNHGDHDALAYDGPNSDLAHLCQVCGAAMPPRVDHVFMPVVVLTERGEGYTVDIDWAESFQHTTTDEGDVYEHPNAERASNALDAWLLAHPQAKEGFTLPETRTERIRRAAEALRDALADVPPSTIHYAVTGAEQAVSTLLREVERGTL